MGEVESIGRGVRNRLVAREKERDRMITKYLNE